ncbi:helix-turn-helix domain-containing protein [Georgenia wangjunii]|uniref:helix-turn-helix domain-containing protein n=1 Tax=Georgenia wangjunii TaxID=3117730 RepID=UPI002F26D0C2
MVHRMEHEAPLARLIGERVRNERQARQWTLDQLANFSDVSRRMLVNIEQGAANPSIGILLKLSDALGVGLPALVEQPRPTSVKVTRRGSGPVLWSSEAGGRAVLVANTVPPDVVELWDWALGPGDRSASEAHVDGTRELLHVLEGEATVEVAEQVLVLQAGDALSFPGDVPHAYANPGATPVRFSLSVFEPAVGTTPRGRTAHA